VVTTNQASSRDSGLDLDPNWALETEDLNEEEEEEYP
jgi:hypothetical protein